ncbi:MAG: hypothetical protein ACOCV8_02620, partial [Spirochaetota bacterium]
VFYDVGDIKLQATYYVKRAKSTINDRLERFSHRGDNIISKYNYDTKFASHLMRLLLECEEFIDNGKVIFPLQYADFLIDIKKGKYTIDELIKESEKVEKRIVKKSESVNLKLREKPDFQYVENTVIKMLKSFLCK